jgi:hypothetical protein
MDYQTNKELDEALQLCQTAVNSDVTGKDLQPAILYVKRLAEGKYAIPDEPDVLRRVILLLSGVEVSYRYIHIDSLAQSIATKLNNTEGLLAAIVSGTPELANYIQIRILSTLPSELYASSCLYPWLDVYNQIAQGAPVSILPRRAFLGAACFYAFTVVHAWLLEGYEDTTEWKLFATNLLIQRVLRLNMFVFGMDRGQDKMTECWTPLQSKGFTPDQLCSALIRISVRIRTQADTDPLDGNVRSARDYYEKMMTMFKAYQFLPAAALKKSDFMTAYVETDLETDPLARFCFLCGIPCEQQLGLCLGCGVIRVCTQDCLAKHWKKHELDCHRMSHVCASPTPGNA